MAVSKILGNARVRAICAVLPVLLSCLSGPIKADEPKLSALAPPEKALRLTPRPDGAVLMQLDLPNEDFGTSVTIKLHPFTDADGNTFQVGLESPGAADSPNIDTINLGMPFLLRTADVPKGRVVWGLIEAKLGSTTHRLPLVLGPFGPAVGSATPLDVSQTGRARLILDVSQHRGFGKEASFELTTFSSQGHDAEVGFPDPAKEGHILTSREVELPETAGRIALEIDASSLRAEKEYTGALRTKIGAQSFIDTPIVLKRQEWQADATFQPIESSHGPSPLALSLTAADDQTVYGFWVASVTGAKEGFSPSTDLEITLDGEPVRTLDATDPEQVRRRTLEPGVVKEIVVAAKQELPTGSHEVTLKFGALNVDPANWPETKVTLVARRHWGWAVSVLVIAVLLSYGMTKGVSATIQRRNLRTRISAIQKKSWLRSDRWGALPVVRAFGRAKMADLALSPRFRLNLAKWLSRFVTTPELLSDEIKEVEDRMAVLKRLNALAIYWKAAPSASGVKVSGVDDAVVYRAQKILRGIVDHLSQVQEGETVGAGILDDIAALEGWEDRQKLETGYWANLRGDIQLLLDAVDPDHFEFDDTVRQSLQRLLQDELVKATDDAAVEKLKAALAAVRTAARTGVASLRAHLTDKLAGIVDADAVEDDLKALEACEREVVRKLCQELDLAATPGSLNDMIRKERIYTQLKLIWEQRNDEDRRTELIEQVRSGTPLEKILKKLDDDVWERLKAKGAVRIVPPDTQRRIEEFQPIDFRVECTDSKANTFLFKHGLEYEWTIDWGGDRQLKPITRSTIVTQFVPQVAQVRVGVTVRRGRESFSVGLAPDTEDSGKMAFVEGSKTFKTVPTSAFKHLWPTPTPEIIGILIALVLALVAGFQSDAFTAALEGSWQEYLALFAWGVGADQTKNLLANLNSLTKGEGAVKT